MPRPSRSARVRLWRPRPKHAAVSASKPKTGVNAKSIAFFARGNSTSACGKTDSTTAKPAARPAITRSAVNRVHSPRLAPPLIHPQAFDRKPDTTRPAIEHGYLLSRDPQREEKKEKIGAKTGPRRRADPSRPCGPVPLGRTCHGVTVKVVVAFRPEVRPMPMIVIIPESGPGPING